ncbi:MAG: response regulator transcription factor [Gemmatimonadota bacterium]
MLAVEVRARADNGAATTYLLVVERESWPSGLAPPTLSSRRDLTEREGQVVLLISRGRTNLEIAAELGISVSAVKRHVERLMRKTGTHRRTALPTSIGLGWSGAGTDSTRRVLQA